MQGKQVKQQGMVLVLAVLIISAAMATAAIIGNVIIDAIRQSRLINQASQAYYVAESGAERALYQVRKKEAVSAQDCPSIAPGSVCDNSLGVCTNTGGMVSCIATEQGGVSIGSGWNVTTENEMSTTFYLSPGDTFQIDLFNPFQRSDYQPGVRSFRIKSDLSAATSLYGEITNVTWLVGPTADCPLDNPFSPSPSTAKEPIKLDILNVDTGFYDSNVLRGLNNNPNLDPDCLYVMRVSNILDEALFGNFTIELYNESEDVDFEADRMDIPSRLIIDSEARYRGSQQNLRVRTPIRPPLSGLYDFVIFSELEIDKTQ